MLPVIKSYIGYASLICFVISGLVLNILQILLFILIRPFNQNLFRKVNHYLLFSSWSQPVATADWLSNLQCKIYFANDESRKNLCDHSGLMIANHRYDIDWLTAWMLSDKFQTLGNDKAMIKSSLRYVPIIGWGWSLCDMIFLSRDWKKDKENLVHYMKVLLTYPRSPLLAYFEGTRFTPSKHEASIKFAKEKGLDINLKHHLVPRSRGFNCLLKIIKDETKKNPKLEYDLYNMEVALDNDDNKNASLTAVISGRPSCAHIYLEKIDYKHVNADSEEESSKFLFDIYKKKDEVFEYFLKNGKFPGKEFCYEKRTQTLLNLVFWLVATFSVLLYLYYICLTSGSRITIGIVSFLAIAAIASLKILINSTKVSKSSSYGTDPKKNK